jgi:hypothetical protein
MVINKEHISIMLLYFLIALFPFKSLCQNLVPNGSFEKQNYPFFLRSLYSLSKWNNPSSAQPTLIKKNENSFGVQKPLSARSYISLEYSHLKTGENSFSDIYYIAYIQVKLSNRLKKDSLYCLKLYTSLADNYEYAIENMEAGFSNTKIKTYQNKLFIEPDYSFKLYNQELLLSNKEKWVENCACIKATGKERYLQIGYFSKDLKLHQVSEHKPKFLATNYFIDDVSLMPINHIDSCDCTKSPSVPMMSDYLIETYDTSQNNGYSFEIKDIYFRPNDSLVDSSYKPYLKEILNYLILYPNKKMILETYCSPNELKGGSCNLAKSRAETITDYFTSRGISRNKITIKINDLPISTKQRFSEGTELKNKVSLSFESP